MILLLKYNINNNMENTHRLLHEELLGEVHEELLYLMNTYICDNDMCEQEFDITGPDVKVETIANRTYSFCCEHCCSYGSWSIRYDLRKHYRKMSG
tara:strand:- start:150 stop:437 length:288 start_codon:yes stop_codon:yes gene_type:complete